MPIPATLAEKIALFEEAAIIVREDNELFTEEGWGQVMIGQGLEPRSFSPLAWWWMMPLSCSRTFTATSSRG